MEKNSAYKLGQINQIRISGQLDRNIERAMTDNGRAHLKTVLHVPQENTDPPYMRIYVTLWLDKDNPQAYTDAQVFTKGNDVVVVGKLSSWVWRDRTYLGITATSIE